MNDMVPLLAGCLAGLLLKEEATLRKIFHVADFSVAPPDSIVVRFASGIVLRIRVEVMPDVELPQ